MTFTPTLPAADVFDPTDGGGTARKINNAEAQTWAQEVEDQLEELTAMAVSSVMFTAGAYTIPSYRHGDVLEVDSLSADSTLTLPSATTYAGMLLWIKRTDTSSYKLTISRANSDTIDGWATSFDMLSVGDTVGLVPKSGGWRAVAIRIAPIVELVTATEASRTLYAGSVALDFHVVGGGGGGGGVDGTSSSNANAGAGGGGAGGEVTGRLNVRTLTTVGLTIGAAGAAGADTAGTGGSGGSSELTWEAGANKVTAGGGSGGAGANATASAINAIGGGGGQCSTTGSMSRVSGLVQQNGSAGDTGVSPASNGNEAVSGAGASSNFGGGGGSLKAAQAGWAGQGYGSGGGGARATTNNATNYAGGAGAPGAIRLVHHILR